jgi:hypothetical protein
MAQIALSRVNLCLVSARFICMIFPSCGLVLSSAGCLG